MVCTCVQQADQKSVLTEEQVKRLADSIGCARIEMSGATDSTAQGDGPIRAAVHQLMVRNRYT